MSLLGDIIHPAAADSHVWEPGGGPNPDVTQQRPSFSSSLHQRAVQGPHKWGSRGTPADRTPAGCGPHLRRGLSQREAL